MVSWATGIPEYKQLEVPVEINLTTPNLKAAAPFMHNFCDKQCKEFMLCRAEEEDPRACLKEGKDVTNCGVKFLQGIKLNCRSQFEKYTHCLEHGSPHYGFSKCRMLQYDFDNCVYDKMSIERPPLGALSKPHIVRTDRPKPEVKTRDYKAEALELYGDKEHATDYKLRHNYYTYKGVKYPDMF